jgi:(2Fe-2S) ferredoxin
MARGGAKVQAEIKEQLAAQSLAVEYDTYKCFGACEYGPNLVLYPQLELYSGLTPQTVPLVLERLQGGPVPSQLVVELDPESEEDVAEALDLIREDYE